jgi:transcription initiation factor TFIIIB Brf1 subunit/transcription initiation factor TFIIB
VRCICCNSDKAEYDPVDNNWYCQECMEVISETLLEYEELEDILDDLEE